MTFGQNLRAARKAKGLTVRSLAASLAVSHTYLSMVERGIKRPISSDANVMALSVMLGISPFKIKKWADADRCSECGHWKSPTVSAGYDRG